MATLIKDPKNRRLTLKQEKFAHEYIANGGNATAAVGNSYPGHKSYGSRAVTGHDNLKNPKIKNKIDNIKKSILSDLPAIGEQVLKKLVDSFQNLEECSPRDIDKLGRTLLEVGGFLGAKQNTTVNITINRSNATGGCEVIDIERLGAFDCLALQDAIKARLEQINGDSMISAMKEEWDSIPSSDPIKTVDYSPVIKEGKEVESKSEMDKETINKIGEDYSNISEEGKGEVVEKDKILGQEEANTPHGPSSYIFTLTATANQKTKIQES